jgi:N-acetylglucosamine-6-sulfatase
VVAYSTVPGFATEVSPPFIFTRDSVAPVAPSIREIVPLDATSTTEAQNYLLRGTAEAGTYLYILRSDLGPVGSNIEANETGEWQFNFNMANAPGGFYAFTATAADLSGNVSQRSTQKILTMGQASVATPEITSLTRNRQNAGFTFSISGTAEPNKLVVVHQTGVGPIGAASTNANGTWNLQHTNAQVSDGVFQYFATASDSIGNRSHPSALQTHRPNVVLFNLDDMRADAIAHMPNVQRLLAGEGTLFQNSFVPTALSGPSRQSLLTGLYAHNTGVYDNEAPLGGEANRDYSSTLATWYQSAGYKTAFLGKIGTADASTTQQGLTPPAEWDIYHAQTGAGGAEGANAFYGFAENRNGQIVIHSENEYSTDVWANDAATLARSTNSDQEPLFLYFAPAAPHRPFFPAQRHVGALNGIAPARPPSFNVIPEGVNRRALGPGAITALDTARQKYLETLLAVDDAVLATYTALQQSGELDNTLFLFTGDNGYTWGEHALSDLKHNLTEEAIRVPLIVRDGRAPLARVVQQLALNIDIAPSLAQAAGITIPNAVDGLNLLEVVHGSNEPLRDAFLLDERWSDVYRYSREGYGNSAIGIRTQQWKYVEYESGFRELFFLSSDPYELTNLANKPEYATTVTQLKNRMEQLRPTDRLAPDYTIQSIGFTRNLKGFPQLTLQAQANEAATGNAQVRTGEYFIDTPSSPGSGHVIYAGDGKYNQSSERMLAQAQLYDLMQLAPGPHSLLTRARDVAGNWTALQASPFELEAAPLITAGATAIEYMYYAPDGTMTLQSNTPANSAVTIYAISENGVAETLLQFNNGNTSNWSRSITLTQGTWRIMVAWHPAGNSNAIRLSAATIVHVLTHVVNTNSSTIRGTNSDDKLRVQENTNGNLSLFVNDIFVGNVERLNRLTIEGLEGNDSLTYVGSRSATLLGGEGNDILQGGSGGDTLNGGAGTNELRGNLGNDTYKFTNAPANRRAALQTVIHKVWEQVGEGNDTFDFSELTNPAIISLDAAIMATFNVPHLNLSQRVIRGDLNSDSIENVRQP